MSLSPRRVHLVARASDETDVSTTGRGAIVAARDQAEVLPLVDSSPECVSVPWSGARTVSKKRRLASRSAARMDVVEHYGSLHPTASRPIFPPQTRRVREFAERDLVVRGEVDATGFVDNCWSLDGELWSRKPLDTSDT